MAKVDHATQALCRFDAEAGHTLLPFVALLLRGESFASSRIENLSATARRVMEAEAFGLSKGNAELISANTQLMRKAIDAGEVSYSAILDMHSILMDASAPDIAGHVRKEQVWIGGSDAHPVGSLFVPPHHDHVEGLLHDLAAFCSRTDIPALIQAAVAHAQFETIHPFADGNGRTGRALIHALFAQRGLTTQGIIPISAGILRDTGAYFAALTSYREGDPVPIIALCARAAVFAAERGQALSTNLMDLRKEWQNAITARADAVDWKVADMLFEQPLVDAAGVAAALGVSDATARRSLERLEADGIVLSAQVTKAKRAWRAPEILELLDAFADETRRSPFLPED